MRTSVCFWFSRAECSELVSAQLKPAHVTGLAPNLHQREEGVRPGAIKVVKQALAFPGAPFTIVIARSAGLSECESVNCSSANGFEPARLGLESRLHDLRLLLRRSAHDMGNVARLFVQHVREVRRKGVLGNPKVETVRKAMAVKAVQRAQALGPVVGELAPVAAVYLKAGPPCVGSAHLEA